MRTESVASIKGRRAATSHLKPTDGSKLRELYDRFMENKGYPIVVDYRSYKSRQIPALRDFHGLDIRSVGHKSYVLAGEWFGSVYVDYIADRIKEEEQTMKDADAMMSFPSKGE